MHKHNEMLTAGEVLNTLNIYNSMGQVVYTVSGIENQKFIIRIEEPAGLYYLEITSGTDRFLKKILLTANR